MCTANLLLNFLRRILGFSVNRDIGAELTRKGHFFRTKVHRRDVQSHGLRILNGDVAQAAYSRDHHPFTGPRLCHFQTFVSGDSCAEDGRGIHEGNILGKPSQVIRLAQCILRKTSVHRISGVLLLEAKCFPSGETVITMPARAEQPRGSDSVAFLQVSDPWPKRYNDPCSFMARNKWRGRLDWPVAVRGMQVGVTYSGRIDFYQGLPRPRRGDWYFSHNQRLAKFFNNRRFHRFFDRHFSSPYCARCCHCSAVGSSDMYHSAQLGVMPVTEWNPLDSVQPDFKPRSGDGGKYRERMPRNGNGRCTAAFR